MFRCLAISGSYQHHFEEEGVLVLLWCDGRERRRYCFIGVMSAKITASSFPFLNFCFLRSVSYFLDVCLLREIAVGARGLAHKAVREVSRS